MLQNAAYMYFFSKKKRKRKKTTTKKEKSLTQQYGDPEGSNKRLLIR